MTLKAHRLIVAILVLSGASWACGHERWPVKVLTDADHASVNRTARSSTVHALVGLIGPANSVRTHHQNTRISPVELKTYRVHALLIGFKHESDDDDFHLVIANPANAAETMIAEIPDPGCVTNARLKTNVKKFHDQLVSHFGTPGTHTMQLPTPAPIIIRGVGFWDIQHGTPQTGKAPNNIELHPVLGLSIE